MYFKPDYLIYPAGERVTLTVKPVFPVTLNDGCAYTLRAEPFGGVKCYALRNASVKPGQADIEFFAQSHALTRRGDGLELSLSFPQEDCYIITLYAGEKQAERFRVYALERDLFALTPYRGDNHMHSCMSDGKDSPEYMAAAACKNGSDYCLITDHYKYEPSLRAKAFYENAGADMLVIPGEEVHSPDNPVHIINFGGKASVNLWFQEHEDEYRAAVAAELQNLPEYMEKGARYAAAACQVMFDRIHKEEGLAVLCHPHWIVGRGFNQPEDVTEYLFDNRRFDALELIAGGAYEEGTQHQISYYKDRPAMPVLGSSDAHGCFNDALEPGNYTIVFASALNAEAIKRAVALGLTAAGSENKLYGPYRLVKYAYFLKQAFYPLHAGRRAALGAELLRLASGKPLAELKAAIDGNRPSELFGELRYKV